MQLSGSSSSAEQSSQRDRQNRGFAVAEHRAPHSHVEAFRLHGHALEGQTLVLKRAITGWPERRLGPYEPGQLRGRLDFDCALEPAIAIHGVGIEPETEQMPARFGLGVILLLVL